MKTSLKETIELNKDNVIENEVAPTITANCMQSINHQNCGLVKTKKSSDERIENNIVKDGVAQTLTTNSNSTDNGVNIIEENLRIRKLTPCECMLLMGFTKEDYENMVKAGLSDSAIYHIAGDSIVVPCIAALMYDFFKDDENGHIDLINRYVDERVKEIKL